MNSLDKQYFGLLNHILRDGITKGDRTGTGTKSVFDYTIRHNMMDGFPMITSKKVYFKGVAHELLWFLRGNTNIKYLVDNDVNIWNGDAYKNYEKMTPEKYVAGNDNDIQYEHMIHRGQLDHMSGYPILERFSKEEFIGKIKTDDKFAKKWGELGPVYGKQWRNWTAEKQYEYGTVGTNIDQIKNLINDLKNNPDSRRLMVNAWNVSEIDQMVLPPCHYGFQCYVSPMTLDERKAAWCESISKNISYAEDLKDIHLDNLRVPSKKLSLKFTMRSIDVPLGLPFNITSYGLLLKMLANEVEMSAGDLIFSGGDCHIYLNQIDGIKQQLDQMTYKLPHVKLKKKSIYDLQYEDIELIGYESSKSIKIPLSN